MIRPLTLGRNVPAAYRIKLTRICCAQPITTTRSMSKWIGQCNSRYNIFPPSQDNDNLTYRHYHSHKAKEEKEEYSSPRISSSNTTGANKKTTQSLSQFPLSNSNPNETTIDDKEQSTTKHQFVKLDPRAIFPWRHSPQPLPRLIPDTPEFTSQGGYIGPQMPPLNSFIRGLCWVNAAGFLGGKIMNYWGWKEGLEEGFQLAFAVAVQGLLMDVYRVEELSSDEEENNKIHDDNDEESMNETRDDGEIDNTSISPNPAINFNHEITPIPDDEIPCDVNNDKRIQSHTRSMLQCNLISLYKSAHEHTKHKLQINLQSTPKSATIMSLFTIPFLTRDEVIAKPALKHSFRNISKFLHDAELSKGSKLHVFEIGNLTASQLDLMSSKQMKRRGDRMLQVTVIAQVAIQCDELFQVVDVETGETIQGHPEAKMAEVTHLVRFETVVDLDSETGDVEIGSWQITDWDDILDGNRWFL